MRQDVFINLACAFMCVHVCYSLNELQGFIKRTDVGLQQQLSEGDHSCLVDIMGHLLDVRSRQRATDELFEPLKETIMLLESYGQKLPEQVYAQLEVSAREASRVARTQAIPSARGG